MLLLKGWFTQKMIILHFLTLMPFQTRMIYFFPLENKQNIYLLNLRRQSTQIIIIIILVIIGIYSIRSKPL